jgi:hypothetical protein
MDLSNTLDRRSLMRAAGVLGLAAASGLAVPTHAQASTAAPRFDLAAPYQTLYTKKRLHENRTQQVLAFDSVNRRLFVSQGRRDNTGDDLCLNQVSFAGTSLGTMYIDNCGHGMGLGVEPVGTSSYIWMETKAGPDGRGTALMRFKWVPGTKPANVKYYFQGIGTDVSCAIDPVYQRLVVRFTPTGKTGHTHHVFSLPFGHPERMQKLYEFYLPASVWSGGAHLGGFTPYGKYLYVFTGSAHVDPADIDSSLCMVDMTTSRMVGEKVVTRAGRNLPGREPEGLAVYRGSDGRSHLFYGFGSRESFESLMVNSNIFYKSGVL